MNSILTSIKKMLGIEPDYDVFDTDILIIINSYFMVLNQLGVGPKSVLSISGAEETWDQFFTGREDINAVKSYIYLRVKMQFDPPTSSYVMEAMKQQASELEWRLNIQTDDEVNCPEEGGFEYAGDGFCREKKDRRVC